MLCFPSRKSRKSPGAKSVEGVQIQSQQEEPTDQSKQELGKKSSTKGEIVSRLIGFIFHG
jgi:hypothetical protein